MTFLNSEQQAIYDSLSPKNKAHVDFMASLKELDRSGFLVSTLNPYTYDVQTLPVYIQTRQRKWFFFSKMVTTTSYAWTYTKKDKDGLIVNLRTGTAAHRQIAYNEAWTCVRDDAIAFTMAKLKEINEMPE